ncbi:N-acetylgalactosaminyltransferase 7, partial [Ophiophagus hannah]
MVASNGGKAQNASVWVGSSRGWKTLQVATVVDGLGVAAARNTANLKNADDEVLTTLPPEESDVLFNKPEVRKEVVPSPKLFLKVIKKQLEAPATGPNPLASDYRFFNVGPELTKTLQVPTVDAPVAALTSSSSAPLDPDKVLKAEEKPDYKEAINLMPKNRDNGLIPGNDKFKPVLPWPHVEGVEVDLESIRRRNKAKNERFPHAGEKNDQQNVMQRQYLTFKPQTNIYHDPVLRSGILGNFELKEPEPHGVVGGPGEEAKPYVLGPEYKESIQASIKEFGFNMVASDMISLDRSINDLRQEECKYWHYDENLLTSSVIIVFHNEGWSTLMRTVHSVIKRTPRKYLAEIVLIDDFSNKEHLKERLEDYIKQWNGLVKIFRNERREGLIQARSIGAQKAKLGKVLIYLDAHCEVAVNWYVPLIAPISKDRTTCTVPLIDYIDGNDYSIEPQQGGDEDGFARGAWDWSLLWKRIPLSHKEKAKRKYKTEPYRTTCTVPLIDVIDGNTYNIVPQGGGDEDGFARGAWDWSMLWKRVPLTKREKAMRKTKTEPYRSPAMAGGLFAIERDFFFELGLYDPGLQIWGGENFEISYKIWQCGGKLLFVPCSRVGHIYRLQGWQGNPPPAYVGSSPTLKNYVRVVEVWWDEFKDYFYASRPETKALAYGDISDLKKFREDHKCKSFKWFMEEIAYDITSHYPLPPRNVEWGECSIIQG